MQTSTNQRFGSRCEHLYPPQETLIRYHGSTLNWLQTVLSMEPKQTGKGKRADAEKQMFLQTHLFSPHTLGGMVQQKNVSYHHILDMYRTRQSIWNNAQRTWLHTEPQIASFLISPLPWLLYFLSLSLLLLFFLYIFFLMTCRVQESVTSSARE